MKLTSKDRTFLGKLKALLDEKNMSIELREDGLKRLILRQNYGDRIEQAFGVTRQGVRWRFQRLFNEIYVEAYERIWWIESHFGTELRRHALAIAKQRIELHNKAQERNQILLPRRKDGQMQPD
jgi:hypothetical protein